MTPPRNGGTKSDLGSPSDWLAHAQSDLNIARLAQNQAVVLPQHVCFHAQQAVEKALKAVLLAREIEFPFIHDIEELLEIAERGGLTVPADVAQAGSLTPYAVESRYPGVREEILPEEVAEAIGVAEAAVAWAAATIAEPEGRS